MIFFFKFPATLSGFVRSLEKVLGCWVPQDKEFAEFHYLSQQSVVTLSEFVPGAPGGSAAAAAKSLQSCPTL